MNSAAPAATLAFNVSVKEEIVTRKSKKISASAIRLHCCSFPAARPGGVCDGANVYVGPNRVARIMRDFDYKDVGICTAVYRNIVTGYVVDLDFADSSSTTALNKAWTFKTLGEAREAIRVAYAAHLAAKAEEA